MKLGTRGEWIGGLLIIGILVVLAWVKGDEPLYLFLWNKSVAFAVFLWNNLMALVFSPVGIVMVVIGLVIIFVVGTYRIWYWIFTGR